MWLPHVLCPCTALQGIVANSTSCILYFLFKKLFIQDAERKILKQTEWSVCCFTLQTYAVIKARTGGSQVMFTQNFCREVDRDPRTGAILCCLSGGTLTRSCVESRGAGLSRDVAFSHTSLTTLPNTNLCILNSESGHPLSSDSKELII